jgi:hypothetical protein
LYAREGDVFCEEEDEIECTGLSSAKGSKEPVRSKFAMEARKQKQKGRIGTNRCAVELEAVKMVPRQGRMRYANASPCIRSGSPPHTHIQLRCFPSARPRYFQIPRSFLLAQVPTPLPNPTTLLHSLTSPPSATCSSSHSGIAQSTRNGSTVHMPKDLLENPVQYTPVADHPPLSLQFRRFISLYKGIKIEPGLRIRHSPSRLTQRGRVCRQAGPF